MFLEKGAEKHPGPQGAITQEMISAGWIRGRVGLGGGVSNTSGGYYRWMERNDNKPTMSCAETCQTVGVVAEIRKEIFDRISRRR